MLERGVGGEDGVVGLDDRVGHARGGVDAELELRLLAVVGREALEEQGAEAGAGAAAEGVEDEEALEGVAVVYPDCQPEISPPGDRNVPTARRTRSMTLSTISLPMV